VLRSDSTASLYLDGAKVGGSISVGPDTLEIDTGELSFGQDQDPVGGDFAADESWAGAMDNLGFSEREISRSEIPAPAGEIH